MNAHNHSGWCGQCGDWPPLADLARAAADLYNETLDAVRHAPIGSVEGRLSFALGDLASAVLQQERTKEQR